ncbi:MAG: hypothetical protein HYY10_02085 [Candidatus Liptonbacteria bacterium]|nr:hypothetical protein [Candidatus Liptonbacteria bacterium]
MPRKSRVFLDTSAILAGLNSPHGAAGAIAARPAAVITWNTRHFLRKSVMDSVRFPILTPGDFLHRNKKLFP